MSIRFKFRSSLAFDSVDIGPSSSISVRDLKSKIADHKKLSNNFQDFDLVIADAVSGEEYGAEDFLIPSGSSVVIKRVPAERLSPSLKPSADVVNDMGNKQNAISGCFPSVNEDIENFDDFGTDLYPVLETNLLDSDLNVAEVNYMNTANAITKTRCSESSIARCQNVDSGDLSEAICRDTFGSEGDTQARFHRKFVGDKKLDHAANANSPIVERPDLPSELRCSLCKSIFKEAVLIPCCQHSFCDKCIRLVLIEKAKCPKCLSSKCRVENLLPNLSLRLAIEHFLESQIVTRSSDELLKYAPDEESGIHVKEVSCALSVHRRETVLPHSPSATGKGSNQVMPEPEIEMNKRNNRSAADNDTADGTGSFAAMSKSKKVARACYMCGSPDHLIRECPAAAGSCPMFHPGGMPTYGSPYWHAVSRLKQGGYKGVGAEISVEKVDVAAAHFSASHVWVSDDPDGFKNSLWAGWMISPTMFQDNGETRLFVHWATNGNTGCFNTYCSGFVVTNKSIPPTIAFKNVSEYEGIKIAADLLIDKDVDGPGHWRLYVDSKEVGYWPNELVPALNDGANHLLWGSVTLGPAGENSSPMGNGRLPDTIDYKKSGFFFKMAMRSRNNYEDPPTDQTDISVDCNANYGVANFKGEGVSILYCRPGGMCS